MFLDFLTPAQTARNLKNGHRWSPEMSLRFPEWGTRFPEWSWESGYSIKETSYHIQETGYPFRKAGGNRFLAISGWNSIISKKWQVL